LGFFAGVAAEAVATPVSPKADSDQPIVWVDVPCSCEIRDQCFADENLSDCWAWSVREI
jgi:hypothetical protein